MTTTRETGTLEWIRAGMGFVPLERDADWPVPEDLEDQPVQGLAEGRSRLGHAGVTAYGLRRAVDQAMIGHLGPYGALRYGETFMQVGRDATRRVPDKALWWRMIATEVRTLPMEDGARLLEGLFNADNVKVKGLALLARSSGKSEEGLRGTFLTYEPGRKPWKMNTPRRVDWPAWAEHMKDGGPLVTKASFPSPQLEKAAREIEDGREGTT